MIMFNKYKPELTVQPETVECDTCKHLIRREVAQRVEVELYTTIERWYCPEHKKPYSKVFYRTYLGGSPIAYYGEVQMTEDGTPIGYMKIPEKAPEKAVAPEKKSRKKRTEEERKAANRRYAKRYYRKMHPKK